VVLSIADITGFISLTLSVPGEKLSAAYCQMLLGVLLSNQVILPKIFEEKLKIYD
jgi:hypothetical protein